MPYDLFEQNNQYYETDGLLDATTVNNPGGPTYINNATGQIKILDINGVPQIIGPASATTAALVYVASSNGIYRALITNFNPVVNLDYTIVVDLTTVGGGVYHRELPAKVKVAKAN